MRAIVSYEPGSGFVFPEGEVPPPMPSAGGTLEAVGVPLAEFMALTRIPIVIYYGDNIPAQPIDEPRPGQLARAAGDGAAVGATPSTGTAATSRVVHLPEVGIRGNTHFPFSDLNNLEVADLLSKFLRRRSWTTIHS